ncbi:hypothetical protein RIF29_21586 [Crotalaria pallida]|uniref:Uncharacterized protein n=1 Tax=Crotalaria pallida TaxID=3830 RepID=A0AAN9F2Y6_CROPI
MFALRILAPNDGFKIKCMKAALDMRKEIRDLKMHHGSTLDSLASNANKYQMFANCHLTLHKIKDQLVEMNNRLNIIENGVGAEVFGFRDIKPADGFLTNFMEAHATMKEADLTLHALIKAFEYSKQFKKVSLSGAKPVMSTTLKKELERKPELSEGLFQKDIQPES